MVRAPAEEVDLRCGGAEMVPLAANQRKAAAATGFDEGTEMGKRYVDDDGGLEVLCVKPGDGSLSIGDSRLSMKGAKPLPASD